MGRCGAPGRLLVISSLVIALVIQPASTWSQTQPPFPPPFPLETQAALQHIVEQHLTEAGTPGVVVGVWIPGRGTWVHAQGTGDLTTRAPIRVSDTVRIGSITKTFTATVILQLVDEGRFQLDDRLEQYVPGAPNGDRITIRQVLGMTAGIFSFTDDAAFAAEYDANPLMPFSLQELLVILRRRPPDFPPGEWIHYSDTNYYLLGPIIEQLTSQRVGAAIDQRILQPLRLTGTSFPTTPDMPEPYAHGYDTEPGGGALRDVTRSNPAVAGGAGAMLSTLDDLRLWTEALASGVLLSPTTQRERLQWTAMPVGEAVDIRYGLGILSFNGFIGHTGSIAGYESIALHLPEANATVVVLANKSGLFGGGAADPIFFDIARLLFPERFPQPAATARAESPAPPALLAARGDFGGLVDIGGRQLYLECQGTGSPTIVLEAGSGNRADIWERGSAPTRGQQADGLSHRGRLHPRLRLRPPGDDRAGQSRPEPLRAGRPILPQP
jgi:D-alanyl-D-alanine carboxypeptidase